MILSAKCLYSFALLSSLILSYAESRYKSGREWWETWNLDAERSRDRASSYSRIDFDRAAFGIHQHCYKYIQRCQSLTLLLLHVHVTCDVYGAVAVIHID